jgi:hypothetical protein
VRAETDAGYIVFLTLLGQSMWRPCRARCGLGRFPGLKPRAESCSPSGLRGKDSLDYFNCQLFPGQREQFRNTLLRGEKQSRTFLIFKPFEAYLEHTSHLDAVDYRILFIVTSVNSQMFCVVSPDSPYSPI